MNNLPALFKTPGKATCSSTPFILLFLTAAPWLTQGRQALLQWQIRTSLDSRFVARAVAAQYSLHRHQLL